MRDETEKQMRRQPDAGHDGGSATDDRPKTAKRYRRKAKWGAVAMLAAAVLAGGYWYHRHSVFYPSTGDAYVKAHTVGIAPQVSGRVLAVPVDDQQNVKKGDVLFRIDPRSYRYKVMQDRAVLGNARQSVAADQAAVAAAQAHVVDVQATLRTAHRAYQRDKNLAARGVAPQSKLIDASDVYDGAKAELALAQAQLNEAKKKLGNTGNSNRQVEAALAQLALAKLKLSDTTVTAPCSGRLTGFTLQAGDVVQALTPQGTLVCSAHFWVYANYKETALTRIRPGQSARVNVDTYPGRTFHGIVESINPASGAAFSLLPPENASGNWVKVTQRVPVRVLITDAGANYPMRVQTSAEVTVDTGTGTVPLGKRHGVSLSDAQALKIASAAAGRQ